MEMLPKVIHRFNTIPFKNLKYYFTENEKKNLDLHIKIQK